MTRPTDRREHVTLTVTTSSSARAHSPTSRIPHRSTSSPTSTALVAQHERGGGAHRRGGARDPALGMLPSRCATASRSTPTSPTTRRSTTRRSRAPIFLTGLPRSGTTYFQYLFDQDPRLRMLRTWEGERPSRRRRSTPSRRDGAAHDERRERPHRARGDRRQDRRVPPHRRRRPAGVPGHPRPDLREPRAPLDDVGVRVPRVPAARRPTCRRRTSTTPACCGCCSRARRSAGGR